VTVFEVIVKLLSVAVVPAVCEIADGTPAVKNVCAFLPFGILTYSVYARIGA